MKGNPKPVQELFSHRDDVSLANPFGAPVRGWEQVAEAQDVEHPCSRDGEIYDFGTMAKYVTDRLALHPVDRAGPTRRSAERRMSPRAICESR